MRWEASYDPDILCCTTRNDTMPGLEAPCIYVGKEVALTITLTPGAAHCTSHCDACPARKGAKRAVFNAADAVPGWRLRVVRAGISGLLI